MANSNLHNAKRAKQDEFYTQWVDIEKEMNAYLEYDPDVFKDKVILLPCDDPEWSNFTKYFALRFEELGIKKLISTSYSPKANNGGAFYSPNPGLFDHVLYDEKKDFERGKIFTLQDKDINKDGVINIDDIEWEYLEGDGDFRSDEIKVLRDEADMVITNPPFSLFRDFVAWLVEGDILFTVIGNSNAITYKDVFPLIKENKIWLGATGNTTDMVFEVPLNIEVKQSDRDKAAKLGYVSTDEVSYTRLGNSCWFTNIQHGRRHTPLSLMTQADNERFNKKIARNANSYKTYDNYDAIEVPVTNGIPSDYEGVMGVPISFLDKYCPEQFEILGSRRWGKSQDLLDVYTGSVVPPENDKKTTIGGKETYDRIFIRHIPADQEA